GRGVNRPVVLVDPAVLWRASSEVALQPVRKPRDLPALLPAVAGLEASPGCDSIDLAIMTIGSQGTAWRLRRDIHALRHGSYFRYDDRFRLRKGTGIVAADLPQRQMRRHDNRAGIDAPAVGSDEVLTPVEDAAVLEHIALLAWQAPSQPNHVICRMELRLPVKAQGRPYLEGKIQLLRQPRRQPQALGHLGFLLDPLQATFFAGIDIGGALLQIAIQLIFRCQLADQSQTAFLRLGIEARAPLVELLLQDMIEQAMLGGHLRGRAARRLPSQAARFKKGHAHPSVLQ